MNYDLRELIELEEILHRPSARTDAAKVGQLIADCFFEFGRSGGVTDKADCLAALGAEDDNDSLFKPIGRDYAARLISADTVHLTYKTVVGEKHTHRSSLWQFIDGRWQMIFHQGTPTQSDNTLLVQKNTVRSGNV